MLFLKDQTTRFDSKTTFVRIPPSALTSLPTAIGDASISFRGGFAASSSMGEKTRQHVPASRVYGVLVTPRLPHVGV